MNRIQWYGPSVVLIVAVAMMMWFGPQIGAQIVWAQDDAKIQSARNSLTGNPALAELSEAYRKVAQVVEPSVVHIEVRGKRGKSRANRFENTPFEEFFRQQPRPAPSDPQFDRYNPARPMGNGSGWVYDQVGHIITNYHVVKGADELRVTFFDGSQRTAKVVGYDDRTDIAVLEVDIDDLHVATVAEEAVEPGEIVFAFGSPLGFSFSMSQGIVSAKGRQIGIVGPGGYENFIQTDAAINPGNSGGPLTNIYGEVVGMNSAIASRSGGFMGIGFAIPVEMVRGIADQIINSGRVSRGFLGIMLPAKNLDPRLAKTFGFEGKGVLVEDTTPNSPAAQAGIQRGDIITHVNDQKMTKISQLRRYVASFAPGATVNVTLFRPGAESETLTVEVKLAELPAQPLARRSTPSLEGEVPEQDAESISLLRKFGIESIAVFNKAMADQVGITPQPGILIEQVRRGSLAALGSGGNTALRKGMVITQVMGQPVESVEQLLAELAKHDPVEGIRISIAEWNPRESQWLQMYHLIQLPME